jgi:hypothetical protein
MHFRMSCFPTGNACKCTPLSGRWNFSYFKDEEKNNAAMFFKGSLHGRFQVVSQSQRPVRWAHTLPKMARVWCFLQTAHGGWIQFK